MIRTPGQHKNIPVLLKDDLCFHRNSWIYALEFQTSVTYINQR